MVEYQAEIQTQINSTFGALADPTRRAILQQIGHGERKVTEIAGQFDISLNAVSKHIKKLESAGLVSRRRLGREHYLSVNPAPLGQAAEWFDQQKRYWNNSLDRLEALLSEEEELPNE